jgi:hypothetical protein
MIMFLSSMGLPLLNGFVGEFTILARSFHRELEMGRRGRHQAWFWPRLILLWLYQRVFFRYGDQSEKRKAARSYATRNFDVCAAHHYGTVDWALSQAVFPDTGTARQRTGADIHDNSKPNAPVNAQAVPQGVRPSSFQGADPEAVPHPKAISDTSSRVRDAKVSN